METALAIFSGVALAAACGFRVFVPLLVMSIASSAGLVSFGEGFSWIGSTTAMMAFALATILEILAYFIPWVDNLMDTIATPLSVIAGAVVMASFVSDMDPLFKWTMILVAGGGVAGFVQGSTATTRAISTGTTGGIANPLLSAGELGGSVVLSLTGLLIPVIGVILVIVVMVYLFFKLMKRKFAC